MKDLEFLNTKLTYEAETEKVSYSVTRLVLVDPHSPLMLFLLVDLLRLVLKQLLLLWGSFDRSGAGVKLQCFSYKLA